MTAVRPRARTAACPGQRRTRSLSRSARPRLPQWRRGARNAGRRDGAAPPVGWLAGRRRRRGPLTPGAAAAPRAVSPPPLLLLRPDIPLGWAASVSLRAAALPPSRRATPVPCTARPKDTCCPDAAARALSQDAGSSSEPEALVVRDDGEEEGCCRGEEDWCGGAGGSGVRRPMNAFFLFCKRHRSVVRERYPHLENRAITKILGEWWASLEAPAKHTYTELAKQVGGEAGAFISVGGKGVVP
ncbi:hypothetical protein V5799_020070 [Amblyomma americanum]|uniref:HMG box domain-containing protein n=1 Tax=Amblyomma americanum TaxID=6943 RepID=A0AAQ4EUX8_AMBAM